MPKKKRSNSAPGALKSAAMRTLKIVPPPTPAPVAPAPVAPAPVTHGDCFRAFLDEARSIGNECNARREYDRDVAEYLKQKGLFEEWSTWLDAKRATRG